jgi:excisionase family DNA binding protein
VNVSVHLSDDDLDRIAQRVVEMLAAPPATAGAPPGFLDVKGAAEYLATTEDAIRAALKRNEIPCHRFRGRVLFLPEELRAVVLGEE